MSLAKKKDDLVSKRTTVQFRIGELILQTLRDDESASHLGFGRRIIPLFLSGRILVWAGSELTRI